MNNPNPINENYMGTRSGAATNKRWSWFCLFATHFYSMANVDRSAIQSRRDAMFEHPLLGARVESKTTPKCATQAQWNWMRLYRTFIRFYSSLPEQWARPWRRISRTRATLCGDRSSRTEKERACSLFWHFSGIFYFSILVQCTLFLCECIKNAWKVWARQILGNCAKKWKSGKE